MTEDNSHRVLSRLNSKNWLKNLKVEHLIAGTAGGVSATLLLHPLDLIKIRFQVNDGLVTRPTYRGIIDAFKSIKVSGGLRGLYQGVSPNAVGAGSAWGLYFFSYNFLKANVSEAKGIKNLSAGEHLIIGAAAGASTLCITNPVWVVKTRMCLQFNSQSVASEVYYKGVIDGLIKLYKHEGIRGYYKGFLPGLFGVSHGAIQFMTYEELKKWNSKYTGKAIDSKQSAITYIVMAALSKVVAVVVTYPYQVVRSRLQDREYHQNYKGIIDMIKKTLRNEGTKGFYKGLTPNLLRVTPACCITFVVYENLMHFLKPILGREETLKT
ncbi:solute carrier family 25 member 32-like [Rhopilema esculentum]|uniref:solute carrier family 25 member 32-like n=1 Tax=Rhopilema esculentum TaxID=499914 RepID=UPI0031D2E1F7